MARTRITITFTVDSDLVGEEGLAEVFTDDVIKHGRIESKSYVIDRSDIADINGGFHIRVEEVS